MRKTFPKIDLKKPMYFVPFPILAACNRKQPL